MMKIHRLSACARSTTRKRGYSPTSPSEEAEVKASSTHDESASMARRSASLSRASAAANAAASSHTKAAVNPLSKKEQRARSDGARPACAASPAHAVTNTPAV